ncbi:hypothetical protein HMPREF7215_0729 [Pyramidobacter piscolens W5455]|uniref:Glycosyltransferase RgtA/B/C/D-like domain-containing protein n=3 Tax=Pyramidobacter piscolens TaxID=638849 RepID=A0ABP2HTL7_9BACT|nr:glucosyltransferase domain-containing protein [Pyramidobacter piscolens]EFB90612.1 hypothetical protein HMPREF7215_0729 [Pyramidobacter piscolens W5455]
MEQSKNPCRLILLSALLWGLFAHGMMLLNKFSFHDDAKLGFGLGATVTSGRWMLEVLKRVTEFVFGGTLYSLPLFNGLLTLILVGLAACMTAKIFRLQRVYSCVLLAGVMVAFPVVTAMMGYMYTVPYYMIGLDLAVAGAWLICDGDRRHWYRLPAGCVLAACAVGVYQSCIPIVLSVMLLHMMMSLHYDASARRFDFFWRGLSLALACALFMTLYLAANWLSLRVAGAQLSDYESINTFGFGGWSEYLDRAARAYREFFLPPPMKMRDMYPTASLRWLYQAVLWFGVLLGLDRAAQLFRHKPRRGLEFLLTLALLPLAVNFIHVMVDVKMIHSLMVYSKVFVFVGFICLLENAALDRLHYPRWIYRGGVLLMFCVTVLYCHFSNICYFKANFLQNQAIGYFTRLATRIESVPGYSPYLPVAFLNDDDKQDFNAPVIPEFERIRLIPYLFNEKSPLINNYAWKNFMRMWCDYSPIVIENVKSFEKLPEVMAMPRYPLEGSIRVVNEAVVVKF